MKSKLNLDPKIIDSARSSAARIAQDMQKFIDRHTTVSTERTVLRLLGIDGVDDFDFPLFFVEAKSFFATLTSTFPGIQ